MNEDRFNSWWNHRTWTAFTLLTRDEQTLAHCRQRADGYVLHPAWSEMLCSYRITQDDLNRLLLADELYDELTIRWPLLEAESYADFADYVRNGVNWEEIAEFLLVDARRRAG